MSVIKGWFWHSRSFNELESKSPRKFCGSVCFSLLFMAQDSQQATLKRRVLDSYEAASQGDASAQCVYGLYVERGRGVQVDLHAAARHFKMSAEQDNPHGQCHYGRCLLDGKGVDIDEAQGAQYLRQAADSGLAYAQYLFGNCLADGKGVRQNLALAMFYWGLARAQGYYYAAVMLEFYSLKEEKEGNGSRSTTPV
jgi:TPR repeat protein